MATKEILPKRYTFYLIALWSNQPTSLLIFLKAPTSLDYLSYPCAAVIGHAP
jgi:hypothetical protein